MIPSLSFVIVQHEKAIKSGATNSEDYILIMKRIISKLRTVTSAYRSLHAEVIEVVNKIIDENQELKSNYFLVGISLLSLHNEIKGKLIPVNLSQDADELIDMYASEDDDSTALNDNGVYAKKFIGDLERYYFM